MLDFKGLAKMTGGGGTAGIKIQRQITLPWSEAVRISIRNVTIRLGRTMITGSGIVLGIAFLSSVWTSGVIQDGLQRAQLQQERELVAATARDQTESDSAKTEDVAAVSGEEQQAQSSKRIWLVVMSLLVCGVGITNAMLMSVTERFREIGTMKCLGALDSFIVRLFLIEAIALGVLGSVLGTILGHLAMLGIFAIRERSLSVAAKMDWGQMLTYLLLCILIGTVLSLVSAIAPAVRAARMRPAAALQTEI